MLDARESVAFDVAQDGNRIALRGDGIDVFFSVDGVDLPSEADASFAVWALLPLAMERGFDLHINRPVDPLVAASAEQVSRIWEMWTPARYRSVKVSGQGAWSRSPAVRRPQVQLFSGGIDSTFRSCRIETPTLVDMSPRCVASTGRTTAISSRSW
jgi:hypothetical protein